MFVTKVKKSAKNGIAGSISEITKSNAGRKRQSMKAFENEELVSTLIGGFGGYKYYIDVIHLG